MRNPIPRILVVEDEPLVRLALCDYLGHCGFHVLVAGCADAAVPILEQVGDRLALVFSDIRMPGSMDGFALATWIHGHYPHLPVILTSGDVGPAHRDTKLAPGDSFLQKPYRFEELARRIDSVLGATVH